jgi:predicted permease
MRRVSLFADLRADVRYAFRTWLHAPAFAATAIATIALGIGTNVAIFSLLDALLLRPLPVSDPGKLVRIGSLENNGMTIPVPGPMLGDLRKEPLLAGVCGVQTPLTTLELNGANFAVGAHTLGGDCYRTLGVHAALGRLLTPADDIPNGPHVAVLSYDFWQEKFAANPNVLGQAIRVSGVPFTIVGVTEKSFHGLLLGYPPAISVPISQYFSETKSASGNDFYWAAVLARLKPGATAQQVKAHFATEWRRLLDPSLPLSRFKGAQRAELLAMPPVISSGANGLDYTLRSRFRAALMVLLAISGLVLVVACANVANLLLARGLDRRREISMRLALGAGRWRIVRQLVAESTLLIAAGLGAALLLGYACDRALLALLAGSYGGLSIDTGLNTRVLLFTGGAALIALVLFGLLPAWQTSDIDSAAALKSVSRSVSGARAHTRRVLIAGQVALTLVLVTAGCVFVETLENLRRESLGFTAQGVVNAQFMPVPHREVSKAAAPAYFGALVDRMKNLPKVEDASLSSFSPLFTRPYKEDIRRLDFPDRPMLQAPAEFVSDGFLRTMQIRLFAGRDFNRLEATASQKTAIVSKSLAERLFPEGNAIGRHIRFGSEPETRDLEIVGIAGDARLHDPRGPDRSFLYLNLWQLPTQGGNLQVRYSGSTTQVIASLRKELQRDSRQYVLHVRTLTEQHEMSLLEEKLLAGLGTAFSILALTLAAVGLFGLLNLLVTMRTGEIGVWFALGAERRHVCWLVLREAWLLVGAGLLIGAPLCYAGIRVLSGMLYGVPSAPVSLVALSAAILLIASLIAALIPVYRAGSIDPVVSLRYE